MFKITQSPTFKAPVEFSVLDADGKAINPTFTGIFKRHTQEEIDQLLEQSMTNEALCHAVLVGWEDGPGDDAGVQMPFSAANLDLLLKGMHGANKVIANTFFDKNSAATRKN